MSCLLANGLELPCSPKRTEIGFPTVQGVSGRVTFSELSDDNVRQSPLLHVTLKWRRRKLEVVLYQNQVTSEQTHSEWTEGNLTYALSSHRECFYHGYVKGQATSYSAIATCNGLVRECQSNLERDLRET